MTGKPQRVVGAIPCGAAGGLRAAEIVTDGQRILGFGATAHRPYAAAEQAVLRAAPAGQAAAEIIETAYAELLAPFADADLFGLDQEGADFGGPLLAQLLERPVVWDFHAAAREMGGQGGPLAPVYHFALAHWMGARAPLVFVTLEDQSALSWVDPSCLRPDQPGALMAFETGPGWAAIEPLAALPVDGAVEAALVRRFLEDPCFEQMPPHPDGLERLLWAIEELRPEDRAATLRACAAGAVARALVQCPAPPERIVLCGRGRRDPILRQMIAVACERPVAVVDELRLDGAAISAQAIGFLACRVASGMTVFAPGGSGLAAAIGGGRIVRPIRGARP